MARATGGAGEGEPAGSGACANPECRRPLYGDPPFCPFCGVERRVRAVDPPPAMVPQPAPADPPKPPPPQATAGTATPPTPTPAPAKPARPPAQAKPAAPPKPASVTPPVAPPAPKKARRPWLRIALGVLIAVWFVVKLGRSVGGPGTVAANYQIGTRWTALPYSPGSGRFALAAKGPIRVRIAGETWYVAPGSPANLGAVAPGAKIEVRGVGRPTELEVLIDE